MGMEIDMCWQLEDIRFQKAIPMPIDGLDGVSIRD